MYSASEDDDHTLMMNDVYIGWAMEPRGHLAGNIPNGVMPVDNHGIDVYQAWRMWHSHNPTHSVVNRSPVENLVEIAEDMAAFYSTLASDARDVAVNIREGKYLARSGGSSRDHAEVANLGFKGMAIGLYGALNGPYSPWHIMNQLTKLDQRAGSTPHSLMPDWILALSLGMEVETVEDVPAWKMLHAKDPWDPEHLGLDPLPGSPHPVAFSPASMRMAMEGHVFEPKPAAKKRKSKG